jgi:glycosyltransferase involved in cell wall biosynthesis
MTRMLITADTVGGIWQYATDLAGGLVGHGIEPVLVTLGSRPGAEQRAALAPGVELLETDLPLDWLAVSAREVTEAGHMLARLATRLRTDIVQLNAPAYAAAATFDQPVVAVAHSCVGTWWQAVRGGTIDPDLAWRAELTGAGLRAADQVVAPSGAFATMIQHRYDLDERPAVVRNGRRPLALSQQPQQDFAFTAGRLWDDGKNVAVLDRGAALMSVPLRMAGPTSGPNGSEIVVRHAEALGSVNETVIARHLAARPVFLSSAVYEPFGLAVLEAAQAGCPLVLSDIPTFRELWDGAARFVYPHDAAGFARAVEEIVADPALRSRLGEAAKLRARDYTIERMTAGMAALYAALPARIAERVAA